MALFLKKYCIAGNFQGFQFSWIGDLYHFTCLIFTDVYDHAHYTLYNRAHFMGLMFVVDRSSAKTTKIGPLKNFPLYGTAVFQGWIQGGLLGSDEPPSSFIQYCSYWTVPKYCSYRTLPTEYFYDTFHFTSAVVTAPPVNFLCRSSMVFNHTCTYA